MRVQEWELALIQGLQEAGAPALDWFCRAVSILGSTEFHLAALPLEESISAALMGALSGLGIRVSLSRGRRPRHGGSL